MILIRNTGIDSASSNMDSGLRRNDGLSAEIIAFAYYLQGKVPKTFKE